MEFITFSYYVLCLDKTNRQDACIWDFQKSTKSRIKEKKQEAHGPHRSPEKTVQIN